mmetsp:Transcript_85925/g.191212  ORF Transcript_85925/g.191212 Transcript_85925/m.191212 type:complete len:318 (-) Transcript_85925:36-989(-)
MMSFEEEDGPHEPAGPPPPWLKRKMADNGAAPKQKALRALKVPKTPAFEEEEEVEISEDALEEASRRSPGPLEPGNGSASPVAAEGDPAKGSSWRDFSDVDPLYALLGELTERKVVNAAGVIDEEILLEYIERLTRRGVIEKMKSWVEVWAAMGIPIDNQHEVIKVILQVGLESEVADTIGDVMAELIKGHRVKIKAVEEAIQTLFECGADQENCLSRMLLLIFPKSPTSEWGWARVGWSWQQWWTTADRILATLDATGAFEMLSTLLTALETDSGAYLPHQQIWDEKRLAIVREALCKYGGFAEDELPQRISVCLS